MTRFLRSSEIPSVATVVIPVVVTIHRNELDAAVETSEVILLAEKKKVQAIADLKSRMQGIEFEIENAKVLFGSEA